jgi:hypothetical protein
VHGLDETRSQQVETLKTGGPEGYSLLAGALSRTERYPPRTYEHQSVRASSERSSSSEHPFKDHSTLEPPGHYGENHPGYKRKQLLEEEHYLQSKKSRTISEWLDLCGINLDENIVRWPHDKPDELSDLHTQPKQASGRGAAWRIFKDNRAVCLPSLSKTSCRGWTLNPVATPGFWRS